MQNGSYRCLEGGLAAPPYAASPAPVASRGREYGCSGADSYRAMRITQNRIDLLNDPGNDLYNSSRLRNVRRLLGMACYRSPYPDVRELAREALGYSRLRVKLRRHPVITTGLVLGFIAGAALGGGGIAKIVEFLSK